MSPMRAAAVIERCDQCDRPAAAPCKRCNRPACAEHAPEARRRCADCEAVFDERLAAVKPVDIREGATWYARLLAVVFIDAAVAFGGLGVLVVIIVLVTGLAGVGEGLLGVLLAAISAGVVGTLLCVVLTLPFIGVAGTRALRHHLARREFLAERPGQR